MSVVVTLRRHLRLTTTRGTSQSNLSLHLFVPVSIFGVVKQLNSDSADVSPFLMSHVTLAVTDRGIFIMSS